MATIELKLIPSYELGSKREAITVNSDTPIELKFEKTPDSYQVNSWDSINNMNRPYKKVVLDKQKGITILD